MLQSQSSDPSKQMGFLAGVTGTVTTVGKEQVRGTSTTHYKFTSDLSQALQSLPADQRAAVQEIFTQMGVTTVPAEAWIDDQGLLRRMHMTMTFSPAAPPSAGTAPAVLPKSGEFTFEFYDYGAPVTINVPDPSQVNDFGEMLNKMGAGA
jgi:hypothetical protein